MIWLSAAGAGTAKLTRHEGAKDGAGGDDDGNISGVSEGRLGASARRRSSPKVAAAAAAFWATRSKGGYV